MSRRTRIALVAAVAALSLAVVAAPASAGKTGPNNQNAKKCQKGGWETFYTSAGAAFTSEQECVSHAAQGGSLRGPYDYAGRDVCLGLTEATFKLEGNLLLWSCVFWGASSGVDPGITALEAACTEDATATGGFAFPIRTTGTLRPDGLLSQGVVCERLDFDPGLN